jgi:dienelactone hydrolase
MSKRALFHWTRAHGRLALSTPSWPRLAVFLLSACSSSSSPSPGGGDCHASADAGSQTSDALLDVGQQGDALDALAAFDGPNDSGCAVDGVLVSYLQTTSNDTTDTRCGPVSNGTCTIDLEGFLFIPSGVSAPAPAIVYNHGSEALPGPKCSIAEYFVPRGYVVFVPHRRGQGRSTGVYIGSYTAGSQISYLEDQVADVTAAWTYLQGLTNPQGATWVDPKKMAIMGHSYGGIMTVLVNATSLGQAAAIDLCGDSESWGNPDIESAILAAIDAAQSPVFFAQPQNDVHTDPTIVFSNRAGTDEQMFQAAIYPPVPNAASAQDAHSRFVGDPSEVAQWGPAAVDFLHRYGM